MPDGSGSMVGGRQGSWARISSLPGIPAAIYEQRCTRNLERLDCSSLSAMEREHRYYQEQLPTEDLCTPVGFHFFYLHRAGNPSELSATTGSFGGTLQPY